MDDIELQERVGFFLIPNFSMIALANAVEPLRIANRVIGRELFNWQVIAETNSPVTSSSGISVSPDLALDEVLACSQPPYAVVFVCTGLGVERYTNRQVFQWLTQLDRQGVTLGALCTGAYILAKAGLLQGCKCTIHRETWSSFTETFPTIEVGSHLFETNSNRYTCAEGTAALDMMLYLITNEYGDELAAQVSANCLLDHIRCADNQQRTPLNPRHGGHHPKLVSVIETMETNMEAPLSPDELAAKVGVSRRHLERLFQKYLHSTPSRLYLDLRLEQARHLLHQTDRSILDIALACGFVSASHFSKSYREAYGRPPREERARLIS